MLLYSTHLPLLSQRLCTGIIARPSMTAEKSLRKAANVKQKSFSFFLLQMLSYEATTRLLEHTQQCLKADLKDPEDRRYQMLLKMTEKMPPDL